MTIGCTERDDSSLPKGGEWGRKDRATCWLDKLELTGRGGSVRNEVTQNNLSAWRLSERLSPNSRDKTAHHPHRVTVWHETDLPDAQSGKNKTGLPSSSRQVTLSKIFNDYLDIWLCFSGKLHPQPRLKHNKTNVHLERSVHFLFFHHSTKIN